MHRSRIARAVPLLVLATAICGAGAQVPGPDPAATALIERLGLPEADAPSRDNPRWRKPRKIAVNLSPIPGTPAEAAVAAYRRVAGDVEIVTFREGGAAADVIGDADVIIGFCSEPILAAAKELRWLHNIGVGVEGCGLLPNIGDYDFVLTNNQRVSGPSIAEHAIAMLMALTSGLPQHIRNQADARWDDAENGFIGTDVEGKTLLVAGLGGIGTEIAQRAAGLGMRVIATRNSGRTGPDYVEYVGLPDELLTLAGRADVVANALPLTRATTTTFNAAFFRAVKRGAYFISVGRGETTDTDALVRALTDGTLAGAGLDVVDPEPLPPDHPLWRLPNVVITPHVSGQSQVASARREILIQENLRRYLAGEKLLNVVDLKAGVLSRYSPISIPGHAGQPPEPGVA